MSFIKKISVDGISYTSGIFFSKAISVLLLPVYVKNLNPGDFGILDIIITMGAIVNLIFGAELYQAVARVISDNFDVRSIPIVFSTAFIFLIGSYLIFAALFFVYLFFFNQNENLFHQKYLALNFVIFSIVSGLHNFFLNQLRFEFKKLYFLAVNFLFSIILFGSVLWVSKFTVIDVNSIILCHNVSFTFSALFAIVFLRKSFTFGFDKNVLARLLSFSYPLVGAAAIVMATTYSNRLFLSHFHEISEIGHFAFAFRVASISLIFLSGFQLALAPLIYSSYTDDNTPVNLASVFHCVFTVLLFISSFVSVFSPEIITYFASAEYGRATQLIVFIFPAVVLFQMYMFFPGFGIALKTNLQLLVSLIVFVFSIISNYIFVPSLGALGAGISYFFSSIIFLFLWISLSQRYYFVPIKTFRSVLFFFISVFGSFALLQVVEYLSVFFSYFLRFAFLISFLISCSLAGMVPIFKIFKLRSFH